MVEFELKGLYEKGERLIVEVLIADKLESYSFPIGFKDDDVNTGKPQWMHKVKKYLERTYEVGMQEKKLVYGTKKLIGTIYNTADIEDLSPKALKQIMKENKKDDIIPDKKLKAEYEKFENELKEKREKKRLDEDAERLKDIEEAYTFKHQRDGTCNL